MSGPPDQAADRVLYRYPRALAPEEVADLERSRVVDAERYIEWLETGEGPDPAEDCPAP